MPDIEGGQLGTKSSLMPCYRLGSTVDENCADLFDYLRFGTSDKLGTCYRLGARLDKECASKLAGLKFGTEAKLGACYRLGSGLDEDCLTSKATFDGTKLGRLAKLGSCYRLGAGLDTECSTAEGLKSGTKAILGSCYRLGAPRDPDCLSTEPKEIKATTTNMILNAKQHKSPAMFNSVESETDVRDDFITFPRYIMPSIGRIVLDTDAYLGREIEPDTGNMKIDFKEVPFGLSPETARILLDSNDAKYGINPDISRLKINVDVSMGNIFADKTDILIDAGNEVFIHPIDIEQKKVEILHRIPDFQHRQERQDPRVIRDDSICDIEERRRQGEQDIVVINGEAFTRITEVKNFNALEFLIYDIQAMSESLASSNNFRIKTNRDLRMDLIEGRGRTVVRRFKRSALLREGAAVAEERTDIIDAT